MVSLRSSIKIWVKCYIQLFFCPNYVFVLFSYLLGITKDSYRAPPWNNTFDNFIIDIGHNIVVFPETTTWYFSCHKKHLASKVIDTKYQVLWTISNINNKVKAVWHNCGNQYRHFREDAKRLQFKIMLLKELRYEAFLQFISTIDTNRQPYL